MGAQSEAAKRVGVQVYLVDQVDVVDQVEDVEGQVISKKLISAVSNFHNKSTLCLIFVPQN